MLRVGVILSGSGVYDGSEIQESVLTILALDRANAQAIFFAPNKNQSEVINHLSGQVAHEARNVLVESARISRGNIRDIREARAADLDAVIIPGGWGVVKNLSDFCWNGERCRVDAEVYRLLQEMAAAQKPIGATCIAPAVVAKVLADRKPRLTIGTDKSKSETLKKLGAKTVDAQADEIVVDENLQIITTPAYMTAGRISEVAGGIDRLVEAVLRRAAIQAKRIAADSAAASLAFRKHAADSATARIVSRRRTAADSATARVDSRVRRLSSRATRPNTSKRRTKAVRA